MQLHFRAIAEAQPGPKWQDLFKAHWPAYETWFLSEGIEARATYGKGLDMLKAHMPELLATYERLCDLAGGGDIAARFLNLYRPPAYASGCSQAVWQGHQPMLVRNYDYNPGLCEGTILRSCWNGRAVLAMSDCLWGVLDGVNDAGLVVSLTFGGRKVVGEGFGIPIVLRYILEFCETAAEAAKVLARVPVHMAYNVTALDKKGRFVTALLAPGEEPYLCQVPIATNHQRRVDWHQFARATATLERERFLYFRLREKDMTAERLIENFFRSPVYSTAYGHGYGTLYTAVYRPGRKSLRLVWPDGPWDLSIGSFAEGDRRQRYYPQAEIEALRSAHHP